MNLEKGTDYLILDIYEKRCSETKITSKTVFEWKQSSWVLISPPPKKNTLPINLKKKIKKKKMGGTGHQPPTHQRYTINHPITLLKKMGGVYTRGHTNNHPIVHSQIGVVGITDSDEKENKFDSRDLSPGCNTHCDTD